MSEQTEPASARRVVVAEDETLIRLDIIEILRDEGFEVVAEADNGKKAVELATELKPDLVLMDVKMPVMDGMQALPLMRKESPGSIIVMLSAHGEQTEVATRCRELGASGFVTKGVPISVLIEDLRSLLKREFGTDALTSS